MKICPHGAFGLKHWFILSATNSTYRERDTYIILNGTTTVLMTYLARPLLLPNKRRSDSIWSSSPDRLLFQIMKRPIARQPQPLHKSRQWWNLIGWLRRKLAAEANNSEEFIPPFHPPPSATGIRLVPPMSDYMRSVQAALFIKTSFKQHETDLLIFPIAWRQLRAPPPVELALVWGFVYMRVRVNAKGLERVSPFQTH